MSPRWVPLVLLTALTGARAEDLADRLRKLDGRVAPAELSHRLEPMLAQDIRARVHAAHRKLAGEWERVRTREDWQGFHNARLTALRLSLGSMPDRGEVKVRLAGTIDGDGYRIDRIVLDGRPGLPITANLYLPAKPPKSMPGIVVIHSFFHGKHQGELQDIGVNGARAGCAILVPDLLGHGERRQHPFIDERAFPEKFNVPRQDYYTRALLGLQLDLAGESLMGWFVYDVMRAVDALVARRDVDRAKIVVLGAVAAGGDVAAVAAALDPRIACVVPYNFGGPEPETPYPLPAEGELSFPYASGGHWDSTRRLRNSARDGFLPWVIVGSVAPRRLIHAHEFAWDRDHDTAWQRLERIYRLHDRPAHLAAAFGKGTLFGKPEGTGCGNIGAYHRRTLAPHLKEWFGIDWPEKEIEQRHSEAELRCLTPELRAELKPRAVHEMAAAMVGSRLDRTLAKLARLEPDQARRLLRREWAPILGPIEPFGTPKVRSRQRDTLGDVRIERIVLEVEPGLVVPMLLLLPPKKETPPVVVAVSQHGKQEFLSRRAGDVAALLEGGVAICLPDVRGTGETRPAGDTRGRPAGSLAQMQKTSAGVLLANEVQMLGETLLGERLRDLRTVLRYVRGRSDVAGQRIVLWGDSFAKTNEAGKPHIVPFDAPGYPAQAEPLGGLLALLAALYEDDVKGIVVRGGLVGYQSVLRSPWLHVPADVVVPGMLSVCDLADVAAALAPHPLTLIEPVDGLNRPLSQRALEREWASASAAYRTAKADRQLRLTTAPADGGIARCLLDHLRSR